MTIQPLTIESVDVVAQRATHLPVTATINTQYLHVNCPNEIQRPIANDSQYECLKERNGLNAIPIIYHTLLKKIHSNLTINISRQ